MSVLIKGMEKPEHCGYCRFRYDGICHALQKTQYSMNECPLVVIDDAGLNDTISRQTAIDALGGEPIAYTEYEQGLKDKWIDAKENIEALPSAQSVGCNGCRYDWFGDPRCAKCARSFHDHYEAERKEE